MPQLSWWVYIWGAKRQAKDQADIRENNETKRKGQEAQGGRENEKEEKKKRKQSDRKN